jgi:hypothetical protein
LRGASLTLAGGEASPQRHRGHEHWRALDLLE